jgi:hypothetical protein
LNKVLKKIARLLLWFPVMAHATSAPLPLPVQSALKYRNIPEDALSVYVEEV